jgi:hypothetical protein
MPGPGNVNILLSKSAGFLIIAGKMLAVQGK